jgi:hypothetical protein
MRRSFRNAISWFVRNVCIFSFLLILAVAWFGLRAVTTEQNRRIADNQHHIEAVTRVCITFVNAHNGLIDDDIATLQVALNEHGMFPDAVRQIQARIDGYNSHRVNPTDCLPMEDR